MWGEAILCATYLTNRRPAHCLKHCTPAEMFYGKKPNLKNLHVFGCLAYKHIPKEKQIRKFNSKCNECIMVGYTHNGYRLWNTENKQIVVGRDVIFDESKTIEDRNKGKPTIAEMEVNNSNEKQNPEKVLVGSDNEDGKAELEEVETVRRSARVKKIPERFIDYKLEHEARV